MDLAPIAFVAIFAAGFALLLRQAHKGGQQAENFRNGFDKAYRALKVESDDPLLRFAGASATIVSEREQRVDHKSPVIVAIERYARNDAGEYFFMVYEGHERFFIKHISHSNAQIALKNKYVPPQG
jgi:hypothetical protein